MARRQPLLLGTPSCATSTSSGSLCALRRFSYDDAAFPMLPGTNVAPDLPAKVNNTFKEVMMKEVRTVPAVPPVTYQSFNLPTDTRRDKQFEQKCTSLEERITEQQYEAAQIILRNLHEGDHDPWLGRLKNALLGEEPFTYSKPPPKPKTLYKKAFTPYFTDTTPLPPSSTTVLIPKIPTMSDSHIRYYDDWTDYATEYYGQQHSIAPTLIPKRKRVLRQSSTIRPCRKAPIADSASGHTEGLHRTDTLHSTTSKHAYQFATYDGVHMAYWKYLLDSETTSGLAASTHSRPCDSKGQYRRSQQQMRTQLDTLLRQYLQYHPISDWTQILEQITVLVTLCDSMQFPNSSRRTSPQKTRSSSSAPTAPQAHCNTIGTGIDHFKITHRLQKRHQRRFQFERHQAEHSLCFYDTAPLYIAPFLKQHFAQVTSAPSLRQRHIALVQSIACSPNSHPSCAPALRQHGTNVVLADLLHETAIAPLDFRQHQVSNTTLHDDFSEHMGNSLSIIGGIFTPSFLSPHVDINPSFESTSSAPIFGLHSVEARFAPRSISVELQTVKNVHYSVPHNLYCTVPTYRQNASLTHPDGPGNVLLFDTRTLDGCGSLGNSLTTLTGISRLVCFPYSHSHLSTVVSLDVLINKITQETVTRAEKIRRKRPQRPLGPGHSHIFPPTRVYNTTDSERPTSFHYGSSSIIRPLRPPPQNLVLPFVTSHGFTDIGYTSCHQRFSFNKRHTMTLDLTSLQMVAFDIWQQFLLLRHSTIPGITLSPSTTPSLAAPMGEYTTGKEFSTQQPVGSTSHTQQTSCQDRLTPWSKISTCGQAQDRPFVQRFPERDSSSLPLPSLPSPSSSLYPPQSKFDLDPSPFHLTSYGISYSQMQVLLSLHNLTFCHLFCDCLDWLTQLVTPNETQGIFFHNSHWYAYSQDHHRVHVLLKNNNDPLHTLLMELTSLNSPFHTLSFCFYYAPPTPRGLCGLVAISSLCCLIGQQTQLPALQLFGYTLHWQHNTAVRELHIHYASIVESTNKHFSCGPIGFMDVENPDDSCNDPFTITDTMSPQVPSLHPDTLSIPLISPNFSHEPITYNLHLTDSELADFQDIQTIVDQRFIYFHFDQSLSMNYFHLKDTTTPPQLFSDKWNEFYPCYPQSCIKKILLWDNFLQTWSPTDLTQIDRLPQTNHLRIHFHTRWLHVDFPLIKRSFRIEITPVWTVQHVIDSLQTALGHSSTSLILTQQGRTLPQYFDPWRALPSYTLKPLTAKIPPTLSIHQGRQLAKPLRYCTCNTLCATTHELTKRTIIHPLEILKLMFVFLGTLLTTIFLFYPYAPLLPQLIFMPDFSPTTQYFGSL